MAHIMKLDLDLQLSSWRTPHRASQAEKSLQTASLVYKISSEVVEEDTATSLQKPVDLICESRVGLLEKVHSIPFPSQEVELHFGLMREVNQTKIKEFILHTLSINGDAHAVLFTLFLLIYTLTLVGNVMIIMLVWFNTSLHKPMYIFLGNLSFAEIWYTTSIIPKMLSGFLSQNNCISFAGCFLQYYFFFSLGSTECFLITVMGYDRYLAICHPLRYHVLMSSRVCFCLAASCWINGFLLNLVPINVIVQLPFCGDNKIDHFLCDSGPLLELSCLRDFVTEVTISIIPAVGLLITFSLICISYIFIIQTIIRIPSSPGRYKAFSTCASHLTVVIMYFGVAMYMYIRPSGKHPLNVDKAVAVLYTSVTPLLNPVIYSLRNKEFIEAVKKVLKL
ncbi:olfactory receptor 1020-like [Rhinatrema bivittatum]|uniref:olfactory receptor 1020-like n=1 Tax=Rhinatrema bivittatum TaxID=194408 RepID=UPI0011270E5B|nr:olfactory receptor 1020-like [Rhinatrema bivittatum]